MNRFEVELEGLVPTVTEGGHGAMLTVTAHDKIEAGELAIAQVQDDHKNFIFPYEWKVISTRQITD